MTSLERVFAVLKGRIPGQLPIMEVHVAQKVIDAIHPGDYYDFVEWIGFDAVFIYAPIQNPAALIWIDKEKRTARNKWGAKQRFTEEFLPFIVAPSVIESEGDLAHYSPPDPNDTVRYYEEDAARWLNRAMVEVKPRGVV